ncbi:uncharacterized protein LOC131943634 [Physella acuta]|uniref:uncharacterized protein LOC131943634 n=1 Tax=Physella acuta TaxID=109671 RepID=UPI0027DB53E8|nr:uncharacterized protein LOC131943634 [Physella acuta]
MKTVALISGGKDSCFNMMCCIAEGHTVVALANLRPEKQDEIDSYMYQTVGHMAIDLYAEAMDLPLFTGIIKGSSLSTERTYKLNADDEVEDLFKLLQKVKSEKEIEAVSVGAILSDYQRVRVENVCARLGLTVLAYLWRRDQEELLKEMIACQVKAKIIKVAAMGLVPDQHLGLELDEILPHMLEMKTKYGLNVCGEGGEYETFVSDCPLFKKKIVVTDTKLVIHSDDAFAPVGYLNLTKCHLEDKEWEFSSSLQDKILQLPIMTSIRWYQGNVASNPTELSQDGAGDSCSMGLVMCVPELHNSDENPTIKSDGKLFVASGVQAITSEGDDESLAVLQALSGLQVALNCKGIKIADVVSVSLYVADMANFQTINKVYKSFFDVSPPVRLCIQANLPRNVALQLDCQGHVCDEDPESNHDVLHVQSLSHWAPANIGPYSQAVMAGEKLYVAGMIPLVPASLELIRAGITAQCAVALKHVKSILSVMHNTSLSSCPMVMCYLVNIEHMQVAEQEWTKSLQVSTAEKEKLKLTPAIQYCVVPALPKQALVEWQVYAWPLLKDDEEIYDLAFKEQYPFYTITSKAQYSRENPHLFSCHITIDVGSLVDYMHIDTLCMVKQLLSEYLKVLEKRSLSSVLPLIKVLYSPTVFNYGILQKCFALGIEELANHGDSHVPVVSLIPVDGLKTRQQILAWCQ